MSQCTSEIASIEALLLKHYEQEPFHNLYLFYGKKPIPYKYGGTCSDKTLSFIDEARSLGFKVYLHSGYIDGKEVHRLARVQIGKRTYFADIGNGWPAIKLYPEDEEILYSCFGMKFHTKINKNIISVFNTRNGIEHLQLVIDTRPRCENEIIKDIDKRFTSGINYPFSNSIRFSLIVNNKFLFLRGESLEIYSSDEYITLDGMRKDNLPSIIKDKFKFKSSLFEYLQS
ncbi:hypothetical protein [Shewanella frigidimarina]|uniref:Uncharacterized protein n=1 Tax=Shewanella frigidimarina TaxID=56812 RepID=A0A125BEW2_SHEFR|nr:hypothetical protein [Shewanella frigidimarina]KVX03053.1 hypothetical protein AWJ07_00285 [Shewanella frigidimarina]